MGARRKSFEGSRRKEEVDLRGSYMEMIFIGWLLGLIPFLLGYFIGYTAAKGTIQEKVQKIFKAKQQTETGRVTPLTPAELEKKRTREILDRYT